MGRLPLMGKLTPMMQGDFKARRRAAAWSSCTPILLRTGARAGTVPERSARRKAERSSNTVLRTCFHVIIRELIMM